MINLILVSLAGLWTWETLRGILPFTINIRVAPFVVAGITLGLTYVPDRLIIAGASAGAVAVWRVIAKAKPLPPLTYVYRPRKISPPPGGRGRPPMPQVGKRIPKL